MVKRFTETVAVQPQNLSTGFVQGSNSLLNRLQSFKQSTERLVNVTETQRGQEEAQGQPFKRKEAGFVETMLTGGVSTKAYNKSLETAYLASIGRDTKEAIAGIEAENPDNIMAFNEKAQGYISGVIKAADPSVREQVAQFAENQISNSRIRVHRKGILKNKAAAVAESSAAVTSFGNDAAILSREGNQLAAAEAMTQSFDILNGMVEAGDIGADKSATIKREIEREASEQSFRLKFDGIAEEQGVAAAFDELDKLTSKPAKGWTPDEWDSFVSSQQADLRQKAVRQQQVSAKEQLATSREVSNLKIKAKTGVDLNGNPVDASEIMGETEKLFNSGAISGNERSSIITGIIEDQKLSVKNSLSKQKVAARLSGANEIALTQDQVDLTWDEDIQSEIDALPPQAKNASIAQFVDGTKIVPTQVIKQVTSNLNSGDVDLVIDSANLMDRLDSIRGIPDTNFSPNDRAFAETVVGLQQNMDPIEAVKLATQNTNPNDMGRIDARASLIKADKMQLEYPAIVDNAFDPFFGSTSVTGVAQGQLTKEYGVLFEEHFKAGMSKDAAKEKSIQIIKRNWGETNVTGKAQAIKYPPEDYYAVNGSVDYIGRDLFTSVSDANIGLPTFKKEDLLLISDQTTARTASQGRPSYMVMIDSGEQGLFPLVGFRYIPDMQKQVKKVQKDNEKDLLENRRQNIETQKQVFDNLFNTRIN